MVNELAMLEVWGQPRRGTVGGKPVPQAEVHIHPQSEGADTDFRTITL